MTQSRLHDRPVDAPYQDRQEQQHHTLDSRRQQSVSGYWSVSRLGTQVLRAGRHGGLLKQLVDAEQPNAPKAEELS
ncbi:hypothetical protein PSEUDO8O_170607 [Pseudomonas sp. 8O]|nr:hypothetical protein PSEUDO8O_170607 [Pseudomonas sp. 8O]